MDNPMRFVYRLLLTDILESLPTKRERIDYVIREFTFQYEDPKLGTVDLKPLSDFLKKYRVK
jgi:hypothetical protein